MGLERTLPILSKEKGNGTPNPGMDRRRAESTTNHNLSGPRGSLLLGCVGNTLIGKALRLRYDLGEPKEPR
jgi:hypothetical protein